MRAIGDLPAGFTDPLAAVCVHVPLAARIDAFWSAAGNRQARTWTEHRHINEVMLATSLEPAGYLGT